MLVEKWLVLKKPVLGPVLCGSSRQAGRSTPGTGRNQGNTTSRQGHRGVNLKRLELREGLYL